MYHEVDKVSFTLQNLEGGLYLYKSFYRTIDDTYEPQAERAGNLGILHECEGMATALVILFTPPFRHIEQDFDCILLYLPPDMAV